MAALHEGTVMNQKRKPHVSPLYPPLDKRRVVIDSVLFVVGLVVLFAVLLMINEVVTS